MRFPSVVMLAVLAVPAAAQEAPTTVTARLAGLQRHEGLVPFAWDARRGQLLLEVPAPGVELLYAVGLAGGAGVLEASLDRGQLGESALVRFERVGPRVLLHRLQTTHRSGADDAERTRAITESFPSAVLAALPIVAEEGSRVLVDATDFLLADTVVMPQLRAARAGAWSQDKARSALRMERSGAFPRNTEIEATLTFTSDDAPAGIAAVLPDGRTMSLLVHHSFVALPEGGYEPLPSDPRVGMLGIEVKDYAAPFGEPLERALVARWRLQKKDPSAAVSEPVQPIVFHLDRGMPEPERTAVREAALWWNRAFERAGFRDALVLRDLPAGATFLDARYSGIEWIHRGQRAWSIGEFRVDPRTGEIMQAVARIDSHRRRTTSRMWRNMVQPGEPDDPRGDEASFVLQRLAYLSAHEVGHTLGIDHNWAGTTYGWGSVMDYLGPNVMLRDGDLDLSDAYARDIGSFDHMVVRWAYTPGIDDAARTGIVRETQAQGVVFPLAGDPRWAEYDFGADPVEWLRTTLDVRQAILARFGREQLRDGEAVATLHERLSLAYLYHRFGIQAAQGHVGGQYQLGAVAGDPDPATSPVPAERQRRAMTLLAEALQPAQLDLPERVVRELASTPHDRSATREMFASEAGHVFSLLTAARNLSDLVLRPVLQPRVAARLTLPGSPLALREVLKSFADATWSAPLPREARLAALQRVAQRSLLDALLDLLVSPDATPEVRAAVRTEVLRLRALVDATRSADPDASAHARLAMADIDATLERPEQRAQRRPPAPAPAGRPWMSPEL